MEKHILLILWFQLIYAQNVHLPNTQGFHMVEKSSPQWVTVGQTISLTCKTNQPWNMCRWILPNKQTCDRRKDELYDVACIHNSRVKFQKSEWHQVGNGRLISKQQINQLKNQCTIEVLEATLEDHGTWTCLATENPFGRSENHVETSIEVNVASPYELKMLPRLNQVLSLVNSSIVEEVICMTKGSSLVRPNINWVGQGKYIHPEDITITEWVEANVDHEHLIYQSIVINQDLLDYLNFNLSSAEDLSLNLRCASVQQYPNGSIIYESSTSQTFQLIRAENLSAETYIHDMNVAGITVVCLVFICILVAIALICYAQKTEKWCYENPKKRYSRALSQEHHQNQVVPQAQPESPSRAETAEPFVEVPNHAQQLHFTPDDIESFESFSIEEESIERPQSLPLPTTPQINEIEATPKTNSPPSLTSPKEGFLHQNDAVRLLELINSPPPITPTDAFKNDGFKVSLPTLNSPELSTGLTVPSRQIKRRTNEYVKVRPQSIARDDSRDEETQDSEVTTVVIEHQNGTRPSETAL